MTNQLAKEAMTESEARSIVKRINTSLNGARDLIWRLYNQKEWAALGHKSWRECVVKEFNHSQSYLYRELAAAQVQLNVASLLPEGEQINNLQARALSVLEPEEQRQVVRETQERTGNPNPPAREIEATIDTLPPRIEVAEENSPIGEKPDDQQARAAIRKVASVMDFEKWGTRGMDLLASYPEHAAHVKIIAQRVIAEADKVLSQSNVVPLERKTA